MKEVPKIADMDFMGAKKTRIVISESAMMKETFFLDGYFKPQLLYFTQMSDLTPLIRTPSVIPDLRVVFFAHKFWNLNNQVVIDR